MCFFVVILFARKGRGMKKQDSTDKKKKKREKKEEEGDRDSNVEEEEGKREKKGKNKKSKKEEEEAEEDRQSALVGGGLFDLSVRHGDRYVRVSQVADRPQEIARFVVPLGDEVTRHWNINHLRKTLEQALVAQGVQVQLGLLFERWLMGSWRDVSFHGAQAATLADFDMTEDKKLKQDPVLPMLDLGLAELANLLQMHQVGEEARGLIVEAFRPELKAAVKQMHVCMMRDASSRVQVEVAMHPDRITVGKVSVPISKQHRDKLELLYKRFGSRDGDGFETALAALLLRYDALRGTPFQAALPPKVMLVLKQKMGVFLECFASPLNSYFPRYCSPFPDVEFCFGSLGSFFQFRPLDGSFTAFVPPVEVLVEQTLNHIEDLLVSSKRALSFILILHGKLASEWAPLKHIMSSRFFKGREIFLAKEHALMDGAAYRKAAKLKLAVFETQFLLLQNEAGQGRWSMTPEIVEALRIGFGDKSEIKSAPPAAPVVPEAKPSVPAPSSNWKRLKKKLKKKDT